MLDFEEVPQLNEKVIIIGGGLSLKGFNFNRLNALQINSDIITVNQVFRHIPHWDYWFTSDYHEQLNPPPSEGKRYCAIPENHCNKSENGVKCIKRVRGDGISIDKTQINDQSDSGFGALQFAILGGAKHILMLGIDHTGQAKHFYDDASFVPPISDRDCFLWERDLIQWNIASEQLKNMDIDIKNACLDSRVKVGQKVSIDDGIKWLTSL